MLDKYFPLYCIAFFITVFLTLIIEKRFIPFLKSKAKQPIYQEGPAWHVSKSGTPTMGGLAFLIATTVALGLSSLVFLFDGAKDSFFAVILSLGFSLGNALIGIFDDITKLKRKENAGLTPKQKLFLQFILASLFITLREFIFDGGTYIKFAFATFNLTWLYYPISVFILLGLINSANLTDGIDGLASSVSFAISISLFYICAALIPEAALISAVLAGASLGFLFFNMNPAKIFMGDTGSLFLGALITSAAFLIENPIIFLLLASVYVIEGGSVVLQVLYYKITKKRLFKMAPLHHHLEKCGFSENKICLCAVFLTLLSAIPCYILYLP